MTSWLNILVFGIWLIASRPCIGDEAPKVYEIGLAEQQVIAHGIRYYLEPTSISFNKDKFKSFIGWSRDNHGSILNASEVHQKRVIMRLDLIVSVSQVVYLEYFWAAPSDFDTFIVFDESGQELVTKSIRQQSALSSFYAKQGKYQVLFVIEPRAYSTVKTALGIQNSAYIANGRIQNERIYLLIYGIGIAFIFFNFTMFVLHRASYFLYYVGYSVTILYLLSAGSSHVYYPSAALWDIAVNLNAFFAALMSGSVLRLKEFYPKHQRVNLGLVFGGSMFVCVYLISGNIQFRLIAACFCLATYFLSMYLAFKRLAQGYVPAIFFGLGWGVLFLGYLANGAAMYLVSIPSLTWSAYIAYAVESMLFAVALAYRTRDAEQRAVEDKMHALAQLQKVVYRHQMEQIITGKELEGTMPTASGHACVISFDIIGSSKIQHIRAKEFFRNVFTRCNAIMSEGYDGKNLKANAYRIKEMGDGFLCSVGYPFVAMTVNPTNEAIDLARRFAQVLHEEAQILHSPTPIACGIGIALDTLTGFYPEAGTKEYDIYGPALILATRYEGMRKTLFEAEKGRSVLIIQERVFLSLDPSHRAGFTPMDLKELAIVVRDDPAATKLYFQFLDHQQTVIGDKPEIQLRAV